VAEREQEAKEGLLLDHLERRRSGLDQSMWQAPALTIAAQAFLLAVLTDRSIPWYARLVVLLAGIAACFAAALSLIRLRSREVSYSEAIAYYGKGIPELRPHGLPSNPLPPTGLWDRVDAWVRKRAEQWLPPGYLLWVAALALFVLADVVAFALTTSDD
jgi:hypothetical protein